MGTMRAESAQGTPTQSHISPSILVYEEQRWLIRCHQIRQGIVDVRLPGKKEFKLPWREAGPPNHLDDKVDPDQ